MTWWCEWQPLEVPRASVHVWLETYGRPGDVRSEFDVSFVIRGSGFDPLLDVGFRVPWRRPRPWECDVSLPGHRHSRRWRWREP